MAKLTLQQKFALALQNRGYVLHLLLAAYSGRFSHIRKGLGQ